MAKTKAQDTYGNQSITMLKGADRVRKRPAVIFGSDGLEGCEHCFFEILSNAVDESREGFGSVVNVTVYKDHAICVEDFGRGVPLGYNEAEGRYNWTIIQRKTDTTGNWYTASCTPAANIPTTTRMPPMNIPSV